MQFNKRIVIVLNIIALVLLILALLCFNDFSFTLIGIAIVLVGISLNYYLRSREK